MSDSIYCIKTTINIFRSNFTYFENDTLTPKRYESIDTEIYIFSKTVNPTYANRKMYPKVIALLPGDAKKYILWLLSNDKFKVLELEILRMYEFDYRKLYADYGNDWMDSHIISKRFLKVKL